MLSSIKKFIKDYPSYVSMVKQKKAQEFKFETDDPKAAIASYNIIHRTIGRAIAKRLLYTWVMPNHVTMTGFFLNLLCAYLFFRGDYISIVIAGVCFHFIWILDGVDGKLARIKGVCSKYGAWLDEVGGSYGLLLIWLGLTFGVYIQVQKPHVLIFGFLLAISSLLKSLMQGEFFKTFEFSKEYGKKVYGRFGFLMFFRFGGLFNITVVSLGAFFNKLYWVLIFLGIYGPLYNIIQTTTFTLKARKEYLKEKKIS